MEAVVHRGVASLGLPPSFDPIRGADMDDDAGVSLDNFAAPASSHEDDDMKESDRWRLHSDTSTISSRVTTPDPISPSPHLPPFASISSRMPPTSRRSTFPRLPPPPPPPPGPFDSAIPRTGWMERGRGRPYLWGRGRGRSFPKSPNGAARQRLSPVDFSQQYDPPRPPLPKVDLSRIPPPPTPALDDSPELLDDFDLDSGSRTTDYSEQSQVVGDHVRFSQPSQRFLDTEQPSQLATPKPQNDALLSHKSRTRKSSPQSSPRRRRSNGSEDELSSFFLTRPNDEAELSSSSSSSDDPFVYRNQKQFPPQLPAGPVLGSSVSRSRSSATNHIAAWVSRHENSQSPARSRLGGIPIGIRPADTESRQDGSQDSGDSSHGEIELLWQQLKEKRVKVKKIKVRMRIRRKELRDMRREKDAADNAFMSVVRPMLVHQGNSRHSSTDLLDSRLERMQRLRDDYQVLESRYENLEATLDEEEGELSILETRFFSLLAAGQTKAEPRPDMLHGSEEANVNEEEEIPYELRGISRDGPTEEPHPLYIELASAIGDLENAKEEFEDLHCAKEQFEYDRNLKKTTGLKDLDEIKEFFDEFPSEELRMKGAVDNLEEEVQRLKTLCEERNVMKKHMSVRMEYALGPRIKYEDIDLDDKDTILFNRKTLAHPEFNELLSQPDHLLANPEPLTPLGALKVATMLSNDNPAKGLKKRLAVKEFAIDSLMRDCNGGMKADYVNRWLLHQLRLSPLNAVLLRSTFLASRSLKIRDSWRWQCDVMHYWWRDKTMSMTEGFFNNHVTTNDSEYSSRLGTPQLSRAASDGGLRPNLHNQHHVDNSDAMTVHG
ncbi:hypothetical protein PT974_04297 [Cladobotryum mycophilum]|uniref:Uncharacterized protein n=1 Tax=Cladobotryum mycophilum TaxID=491253 RepID=A0ABR0SUS5_9HYPO